MHWFDYIPVVFIFHSLLVMVFSGDSVVSHDEFIRGMEDLFSQGGCCSFGYGYHLISLIIRVISVFLICNVFLFCCRWRVDAFNTNATSDIIFQCCYPMLENKSLQNRPLCNCYLSVFGAFSKWPKLKTRNLKQMLYNYFESIWTLLHVLRQ